MQEILYSPNKRMKNSENANISTERSKWGDVSYSHSDSLEEHIRIKSYQQEEYGM